MQSPAAAALGGAVVILRQHGRILFNRAWRGFSQEERLPLASASKWLSAIALLRLLAKGQSGLSLDGPVQRHLPGWGVSDSAKSKISLRMLLSHTSGLPTTAPGLVSPEISLKDSAMLCGTLPLIHPPGSNFHYGECGFQVAGLLAERVSGLPFARVFEQHVAAPLGLTRLSFVLPDGHTPANPQLGAGFHGDAPEYTLVLQALLDSLDPQNPEPFLPAVLVREMLSDQLRAVARPFSYTPYIYVKALAKSPYGLGCWLEQRDAQTGETQLAGSMGRWGACPWIDLRHGICGMLLVQDDYIRAAAVYRELQRAAARAVSDTADDPSSTLA